MDLSRYLKCCFTREAHAQQQHLIFIVLQKAPPSTDGKRKAPEMGPFDGWTGVQKGNHSLEFEDRRFPTEMSFACTAHISDGVWRGIKSTKAVVQELEDTGRRGLFLVWIQTLSSAVGMIWCLGWTTAEAFTLVATNRKVFAHREATGWRRVV